VEESRTCRAGECGVVCNISMFVRVVVFGDDGGGGSCGELNLDGV